MGSIAAKLKSTKTPPGSRPLAGAAKADIAAGFARALASADGLAGAVDAGEATGKGMDVAGPARGYVVAVFDYKGRPLIVPCIARHAARALRQTDPAHASRARRWSCQPVSGFPCQRSLPRGSHPGTHRSRQREHDETGYAANQRHARNALNIPVRAHLAPRAIDCYTEPQRKLPVGGKNSSALFCAGKKQNRCADSRRR